jgi:elongation factor G
MQEGLAKCEPTLLEPILNVTISVPTDFTSKVLRLVSGRRGQILGYGAKDGWLGWDNVSAQIPQAEMHDLIVELRSQTLGVGFFQWEHDHLQEVPDKLAERVLTTNGNDNKSGTSGK